MWAIIIYVIAFSASCFAQNYNYTIKYIDCPVDHFSFTTNATFKLRYLYNETYWKDNGPIFFYTGNEGDIETFAQNTGFMWEIAPEFGALLIFAEHRYYGKSLPFGNDSFSDPKRLGYLTSSQAMADYIFLIGHLQDTSSKRERLDHPVVAFGGSYGGMLAAWIRQKYPATILGAIASSAPILQFGDLVPCNIFNNICTDVYRLFSKKGSDCSILIKRSWGAIRTIASTDAGKVWLSNEWKLCTALKTDADTQALIDWLTEIYGNLAMVNYPYPTNFLAPLPGYPVRVLCSHLTNMTLQEKDLIHTLVEAVSIYTNYTGKTKCNDVSQASPGLNANMWEFQACSEMVMPMCSTPADMFEEQTWNLTAYSDACYKKWGIRPAANLILDEHGGARLAGYTNVVFSNGLLDPWSGGGVIRAAASRQNHQRLRRHVGDLNQLWIGTRECNIGVHMGRLRRQSRGIADGNRKCSLSDCIGQSGNIAGGAQRCSITDCVRLFRKCSIGIGRMRRESRNIAHEHRRFNTSNCIGRQRRQRRNTKDGTRACSFNDCVGRSGHQSSGIGGIRVCTNSNCTGRQRHQSGGVADSNRGCSTSDCLGGSRRDFATGIRDCSTRWQRNQSRKIVDRNRGCSTSSCIRRSRRESTAFADRSRGCSTRNCTRRQRNQSRKVFDRNRRCSTSDCFRRSRRESFVIADRNRGGSSSNCTRRQRNQSRKLIDGKRRCSTSDCIRRFRHESTVIANGSRGCSTSNCTRRERNQSRKIVDGKRGCSTSDCIRRSRRENTVIADGSGGGSTSNCTRRQRNQSGKIIDGNRRCSTSDCIGRSRHESGDIVDGSRGSSTSDCIGWQRNTVDGNRGCSVSDCVGLSNNESRNIVDGTGECSSSNCIGRQLHQSRNRARGSREHSSRGRSGDERREITSVTRECSSSNCIGRQWHQNRNNADGRRICNIGNCIGRRERLHRRDVIIRTRRCSAYDCAERLRHQSRDIIGTWGCTNSNCSGRQRHQSGNITDDTGRCSTSDCIGLVRNKSRDNIDGSRNCSISDCIARSRHRSGMISYGNRKCNTSDCIGRSRYRSKAVVDKCSIGNCVAAPRLITKIHSTADRGSNFLLGATTDGTSGFKGLLNRFINDIRRINVHGKTDIRIYKRGVISNFSSSSAGARVGGIGNMSDIGVWGSSAVTERTGLLSSVGRRDFSASLKSLHKTNTIVRHNVCSSIHELENTPLFVIRKQGVIVKKPTMVRTGFSQVNYRWRYVAPFTRAFRIFVWDGDRITRSRRGAVKVRGTHIRSDRSVNIGWRRKRSSSIHYNAFPYVVILIPGVPHHLDIRASHPEDPIFVRHARILERSEIRKWLVAYYTQE